MWRSIFIALGLMAIIVGLECLVIDSANLYASGGEQSSSFSNPLGSAAAATREIRPQEWFPWVVLSSGAVVIIYAFTLPRRLGRGAAE